MLLMTSTLMCWTVSLEKKGGELGRSALRFVASHN
jgi:hypothetical protein